MALEVQILPSPLSVCVLEWVGSRLSIHISLINLKMVAEATGPRMIA
ncbi:Uncharacterised protein [Streptococcus pneumoniae]|nr:Uncharacterised protein [Streptococcus pneumoniae]